MIDIKAWNQAVILSQALMGVKSEKNEKLWIRWVHAYYVKGKDIDSMECPNQDSWIIKKIFAMRKFQPVVGDWKNVLWQGKCSIKKTYNAN